MLVAVIGFLFAIVDDGLERWLPVATGLARTVYGVVATFGMAVILPLVVISFLTASALATVLMGVALVALGLATLGTWVARLEGRPPSPRLMIVGRGILVVIIGFARVVPEISRALGVT